jgi:hypothetical protein
VLNFIHFILCIHCPSFRFTINTATTGRFFHYSVCMNVRQGKQDLLVN